MLLNMVVPFHIEKHLQDANTFVYDKGVALHGTICQSSFYAVYSSQKNNIPISQKQARSPKIFKL